MREIPYKEKLSSDEIRKWQNGWFGQDDNRDVFFREPSAGRLSPTEPPRVILQDRIMAIGMLTLKRLGKSGLVKPDLILGPHGESADFEGMVKAHSEIFDRADALAIKGEWLGIFDKSLGLWSSFEVLWDEPGKDSFRCEQIRWAYDRGKQVFPCSPSEFAGSLVGLLDEQRVTQRAIARCTAISPDERKMRLVLNEMAYRNLQEWGTVGQYGYWCAVLEKTRQLSQPPFSMPLVMPTKHLSIQQKLAAVTHQDIEVHGEMPEEGVDTVIARAITEGKIAQKALNKISRTMTLTGLR